MNDPIHLNARADDCSSGVTEVGRRVIQYKGGAYVIVGFYFARGSNGQRDLYYVLKPPDDTDPAQDTLTRAPRREMCRSAANLTTQTDEPDTGTR
jgi:hypothetical protein